MKKINQWGIKSATLIIVISIIKPFWMENLRNDNGLSDNYFVVPRKNMFEVIMHKRLFVLLAELRQPKFKPKPLEIGEENENHT